MMTIIIVMLAVVLVTVLAFIGLGYLAVLILIRSDKSLIDALDEEDDAINEEE